MKNNNSAIIEQNTKAINLFFECSTEGNNLQTFLFRLMATFTKGDPGYSDKYRTECIVNFENLYTLVTTIKAID